MPANRSGSLHDTRFRASKEEVDQALDGKENLLVEYGTDPNTIKLLGADVTKAIGTVYERMNDRHRHITVCHLGGPGTQEFIAGGVINKGDTFIAQANTGKVVAGTAGRILGRSKNEAATADGESVIGDAYIENV